MSQEQGSAGVPERLRGWRRPEQVLPWLPRTILPTLDFRLNGVSVSCS